MARVEHTLNPAQIDPAEHGAIFYAGGHGTMWDFADNQELAGIGAIYEAEGIVGAVCHGLAALVNLNFQVGVVAQPQARHRPKSRFGSRCRSQNGRIALKKEEIIPKKYRTEKPGFLHNTFAPKSKCSKKVGWVEALVPNNFRFFFTFLLPFPLK